MLDRFNAFFNPRRNAASFNASKTPVLLDDVQLEAFLSPLRDLPQDEAERLQGCFYEKLLTCDLLLPVPADSPLIQHSRRGFSIVTLENEYGERGLPLFTSEGAFALWADESMDCIAVSFSTLCAYAQEAQADYIIINVNGPRGCEISFQDFSSLANGLLPCAGGEPSPLLKSVGNEVLIEKNTPMRLRCVQAIPEGLMERLLHTFKMHRSNVLRAYIFEISLEGKPFQPALGIDMSEGMETLWMRELWPTLQAILYEMLEPHTVMNVFLLNHTGSLVSHIQTLCTPIYCNGPAIGEALG